MWPVTASRVASDLKHFIGSNEETSFAFLKCLSANMFTFLTKLRGFSTSRIYLFSTYSFTAGNLSSKNEKKCKTTAYIWTLVTLVEKRLVFRTSNSFGRNRKRQFVEWHFYLTFLTILRLLTPDWSGGTFPFCWFSGCKHAVPLLQRCGL